MAKLSLNGTGLTLRGKVGNTVYVQTKYGTVMRPRTMPKQNNTPALVAQKERFRRASALWKTLTLAQVNAWRAYAATIKRPPSGGGPAIAPPAYQLFIGLTTKWLQAHPTGNPPLTPPATTYVGDALTVTASGGAGKVVFAASTPNGPNMVTELLLQRLATAARTPLATRYRSQSLAAFASGNLTATVNVSPGYYACAARFVNANTGQQTDIFPLSVVQAT